MYQPDPARTREALELFRTEFAHLVEMMNYLETYYFAEGKTNWMLCERQDTYHAQIDTNNHIEAWHRTLKVKFFNQRRTKRVDRVIFVLSQQATPYYYRKTVESAAGVGRASKRQKKEQASHDRAFEHFAFKRRSGYQASLVKLADAFDTDKVEVQSFSNPTIWYRITIERGDGPLPVFTECTCMDFTQRRLLCKHIALSMLELPGYEFRETAKPRVSNTRDVIQALHAVPEQQEVPAAVEGNQGAEEVKEVNDIIQRIVSIMKDINPNALAKDEEAVQSLKRTLEQVEAIPEGVLSFKRQRQVRY
jgi:hypothetical protein